MPHASDLKNGMIVQVDGAPHAVEKLQVQTPSARGGATLYKVRFRNLVTKQKTDKSFKGDHLIKDADFHRAEVQFMYKQGPEYTFMNLLDYDQFTLQEDEIQEATPYLTDDMEGIQVLMAEGRVLTIEVPSVVDLQIISTEPSMRGASATARPKPATLQTGLIVNVPEYLTTGEIIRVDTRTGKYISRA